MLHKRGLLPDILSFAGKNCEDLTDGYRNCRPPFHYKNSATGESRNCARECYEHAAEWLLPLLQAIPTKMEVSWVEGDVQKISKLNQPLPTEPYFLVQHHGRNVEVTLLDNREYPRKEAIKLKEQGLYLPESTKATAEIVQKLMRANKKGTELTIPLLETDTYDPDYEAMDDAVTDATYRFPGNEAWNRFGRFIAEGALRLQLHR